MVFSAKMSFNWKVKFIKIQGAAVGGKSRRQEIPWRAWRFAAHIK
jgi:hypothetical protein